MKCTRKYVRLIKIFGVGSDTRFTVNRFARGGNKISGSHKILQFLRTFHSPNREMKIKRVKRKLLLVCLFLLTCSLGCRRKKEVNTFWNTSLKTRSQTKRKNDKLFAWNYLLSTRFKIRTHAFVTYVQAHTHTHKMPNNFLACKNKYDKVCVCVCVWCGNCIKSDHFRIFISEKYHVM